MLIFRVAAFGAATPDELPLGLLAFSFLATP